MTNESPNNSKQEIIERFNAIKAEYDRCTDVKAAVAFNGSEWSIADLIGHSTGSYSGMVMRILNEESPNLNPNGYDSEASWTRQRNALLEEIENYIKITKELTDDQVSRTAIFSGNTITTLDMLSRVANHYDEHLAQLRDEVRIREGLS